MCFCFRCLLVTITRCCRTEMFSSVRSVSWVIETHFSVSVDFPHKNWIRRIFPKNDIRMLTFYPHCLYFWKKSYLFPYYLNIAKKNIQTKKGIFFQHFSLTLLYPLSSCFTRSWQWQPNWKDLPNLLSESLVSLGIMGHN